MMNILVDINHPGQVHLFRNAINILRDKGHKTIVTIKDIPAARALLSLYDIDYIFLGSKSDGMAGKAMNQLKYNYKMWKLFKKHKIDIALGSSITVDHASMFCKTKALHFSDDDPDVVPFVVKYAHPFADHIICPDCLSFPKHEKKVVKYAGYHELSYLHPNRFIPDPSVLSETGLKKDEVFFIMRFNVFKAHHDIGIKGLSLEQKLKLIEVLKPHGKIFITTEREIEPELKEFQLKISPEKTHSLIAYATIFLGDSQTMTSEAAVLGTPALKCNSFAGKLAVHNELEEKDGLCFSFLPENFNGLLQKLKELLSNKTLKKDWAAKKDMLLSEKIDVTSFMVWFIENYPTSARILKENPDYQYNFK
jgi:uncharacterized protein